MIFFHNITGQTRNENLNTLINTLEAIQRELNMGKVPSNAHMWKLNQVCAKVHMFGQYIAMVFEAIR